MSSIKYIFPPIEELTNDDRANFARHGLDEYQRNKEGHDSDEPVETVMVDMLADLMHLADAEGFDFDRLLQTATMHHHDETIGL